jgi:hypothetical protein
MKCKLFGHKWNYYNEEVEQTFTSALVPYSSNPREFTIMVDTEFRICDRCQYKQVREHHTGKSIDWCEAELSTEQLRNKKLKELGI